MPCQAGPVSQHPVNLAVRFLLELAAIVGLFRWGLSLAGGLAGLAYAVLLGVVGMGMWATFNVPGDRSRSGGAPVPVSGRIRLVVELALMTGGALGWYVTDRMLVAYVFAGLVVLHYALSWDRLAWLWRVSPEGKPPFL